MIKLFRIIFLLIILGVLLLNISSRGCPKRSRNRVGSSSPEWSLSAPSGLVATAVSYSQINLSWQDNSNNEDGFEIWRSLDGINWGTSPISTTNANVISYSDTGLLPATTYYYRVRAMNTIGDRSPYSNEANATTLNPIWSAIAAGTSHSMGLTNDGALWVWGQNDVYQLGLGPTDLYNRNVPTPLNSERNWSVIATGNNFSLAIKTNGTIWSWGLNVLGQLGLGDTFEGDIPYSIGTNSDWATVTASVAHTVARKLNGTIWGWGTNESGALGLGDTRDRYTPTQIGIDSDWSNVVAGWDYNISIKTNSTLWGWGWNPYGQLGIGGTLEWVEGVGWLITDPQYQTRLTPTQIGLDSDWFVAAAGFNHSIAIKSNQTLWAWGNNNMGQLGLGDTSLPVITPMQVGSNSDWSTVTANGNEEFGGQTIALKTDGSAQPPASGGTIWAWGVGYDNTPTQIGTDTDWSKVKAGGYHTLAIKTNGTIWAWGGNGTGQLGLGDNNDRVTPCQITFGPMTPPFSLIATVISSSQIDLSWIDLSYNELGFKIERKINRSGTYEQITTLDANVTSYSDMAPDGLGSFTYYYRVRAYNTFGNSLYSNETYTAISAEWSKIVAGDNHTIAIKNNPAGGTIWAWGANDKGQLGFGDSGINAYRMTPTQIENGTDWSMIAAGNAHTLALKTIRTIWAWGLNDKGQLGLGDSGSTTNRNTPTKIGDESDWSIVTAGNAHTLALKTIRTIWAWGLNDKGQLGLGDSGASTNRNTPTQIGNGSDWFTIESGYAHSIGLKIDSTLWAWGYNKSGQLGLGDGGIGTDRNTPTQVGTNSDWFAIIAGGADLMRGHTIAAKTNGTIWSWGNNGFSQLGLGDSGDGFAGSPQTNRYTPTQIGSDSNWLAVSEANLSIIVTGSSYSLAQKSNGTIWAWGNNGSGQLGLGDKINRNTPTLIGE